MREEVSPTLIQMNYHSLYYVVYSPWNQQVLEQTLRGNSELHFVEPVQTTGKHRIRCSVLTWDNVFHQQKLLKRLGLFVCDKYLVGTQRTVQAKEISN